MKQGIRIKSRATGLVRTIVVASSTLAILLICFWIYEYSQLAPDVTARLRKPRLPTAPSQPTGYGEGDVSDEQESVDTGRGRIGRGEKIQITLYPDQGDRARLEIAVKDWTPLGGSSEEFLLSEPEVRMRTKDGHPIRVTARRGILEAQRKSGGGLNPRRGKLSGDVLIQYDRLSESDRAALPQEMRNRVELADLVEIRMEEIEFDLEYSKVVVPGPLHLSARDVQLTAADLEISFDDAENRIQRLRIARGGRLELRGEGGRLGISIPQIGASDGSSLSLVGWLRARLEAKVVAQQEQERIEPPQAPSPEVTFTDEGLPLFHADAKEDESTEQPLRYHARFEGDIDARKLVGGVTRARLTADTLEILRSFSQKDRGRAQSRTAVPDATDKNATAPSNEIIVLTWTKRLVVETCSPDEAGCSGDTGTQISAGGAPARLTRPEGEATCRRMTYDPDGSRVSLFGTVADPVVVRFANEGVVTGLEVHSERLGDDLAVRVVGPGTMLREAPANSKRTSPARAESKSLLVIEFTDELVAHGRFVTRVGIDLSGRILVREERVLDRASFTGLVKMRQDDVAMDADAVTITFAPQPRLFSSEQVIKRVIGRGHVVLTRGGDRVECREVDIDLMQTRDGHTVPRTAVARGDVVAKQESGATIQAREKLIVDFETVGATGPFADTVHTDPRQEGLDLTGASVVESDARAEIVGEAAPAPDAPRPGDTIVKRLRAFGEVLVSDAAQGLDVIAETLDCTLLGGREIDTALVEGLDQRPATVRLGTFTVSGHRIKLNVPEQSAHVPGEGRVTFISKKDLDGRKVAEPIPIAVTWTDWMEYRGDENRSLFVGKVHATSKTTTTFDCDRLVVEFADVPPETSPGTKTQDWWLVKKIVDRFSPRSVRKDERQWRPGASKEPVYILATGSAVVMTSEIDPVGGRVKSRARIAGPQLSVDLRPEVSKMVIEGKGSLLLEDNRTTARRAPGPGPRSPGGLFDVSEDTGPSNTLIEWNELMWYDFGVNQTRFEGDVSLKHFSGAELMRIRGRLIGDSAELPPGRATYLTCDVLTVDFLTHDERSPGSNDRRFGGLSADRLKQFQASGSVVLQDQSEGISLTADRVVFWKDRNVLGIYGTPRRSAHIVTQKPGQLPNQLSVERLFYNLGSKNWRLSKAALKTR